MSKNNICAKIIQNVSIMSNTMSYFVSSILKEFQIIFETF